MQKYVDFSFIGTTSIVGVTGDNINGQFGSALPTSAVRKNVPKSANPLKSFNWSKLPDCKVTYLISAFYLFSELRFPLCSYARLHYLMYFLYLGCWNHMDGAG